MNAFPPNLIQLLCVQDLTLSHMFLNRASHKTLSKIYYFVTVLTSDKQIVI